LANHYETLGIKREATAAEVRSAYRRLVLLHHPDHSSHPKSREIFLLVSDAWEVLGDVERRASYDRLLELNDASNRVANEKRIREQAAKIDAKVASEAKTRKTIARVTSAETTTMVSLFAKGRVSEAERMARSLLERDPRFARGWALLADVARTRGDVQEAAKLYAYAAQMAPSEPDYQRRHEEALRAIGQPNSTRNKVSAAPIAVAGLMLASGGYLTATLQDSSLFPRSALASSMTPILLVVMVLTGLVVGASLSAANLLDRAAAIFGGTGSSPFLSLIVLCVVSFPLASLIYFMVGVAQGSLNFSISRLLAGTATVTCSLALAAAFNPSLQFVQILIWGGGFVFLGTLFGWLMADSLRPA
jgi:curved DNA-binding protein CbpA